MAHMIRIRKPVVRLPPGSVGFCAALSVLRRHVTVTGREIFGSGLRLYLTLKGG